MSGSEQINRPKVSIVVPVYNTQEFVEAALRSIMEQTLRQIQIIAINDGSSDGSLAIIEGLASEDLRIEIFSQSNKGLSEARNAGLLRARGQYIYFMDSDDLLEADALELCYQRCIDHQLDVVFFDAESFGEINSDDKWFDYRRACHFTNQSYTGAELLNKMLDLKCFRASACLSFIRLDYLRDLKLKFHPAILHEDELFTPQLYLGSERIGAIPRSFFKRRLRKGSIMSRGFSQRSLEGYMCVINGLKLFGAKRSPEDKKLVNRLIEIIVCSLLRNTWQFPLSKRVTLAVELVRYYPSAIRISLLGLMLFKAPLKKLSGR